MLRIAVILVLGAVLAACGAAPADARFTGADQAYIDRAIDAALGADLVLAREAAVLLATADRDEACPVFDGSGSGDGVLVVTTDCTFEPVGGQIAELTGMVTIVNWEALLEDPPPGDVEVEVSFDGFSSTTEAARAAFDGTLRLLGTTNVEGDLIVDRDGVFVNQQLAIECESLVCAIGRSSTIEVDTIGRAGVSGFGVYGGPPRDQLYLRGFETLGVDFDDVRPGAMPGCGPYTIGGSPAGEYCVDQP